MTKKCIEGSIARATSVLLSFCSGPTKVLSFFSSRWNWDSPTPSLAEECALPPLVPGGGAHSLGRGGGGVPIQTRGHLRVMTYTVVLYLYMYFVGSTCSQVTRPPSGNVPLSLTLSSFCIEVPTSLLGNRGRTHDSEKALYSSILLFHEKCLSPGGGGGGAKERKKKMFT